MENNSTSLKARPIKLPKLNAQEETMIWRLNNSPRVTPHLINDYLEFLTHRRRLEDQILSVRLAWWPRPEPVARQPLEQCA